MKSLSTQLEEYLELRHQMGFDLRVAGRLLRKFVLFAQEKGASFITKEVALTWATQPADCQPGHWANRLAMVRGFAEYSSAIALDRKDVDLDRGLLIIRHSKFNKSRLIPVHDTTQKELRAYERVRDRIFPHPNSPSFFISERGTRLTGCTVRIWFITVSRRIGLRGPTDRRGPRLHDLRHRFAYKQY